MRSPFTTTTSLTTGCAMLLAQSVNAAGFYISEIGTPGSLGTAGVGNVVNTISADAAWTNPAGMTGLKEDQLLAGMQIVAPKIKFNSSVSEAGGGDGGNAGDVVVIPSFFTTKKMSDKFSLGFALVAPQGGAMDYGDNFVGRYGATKVALAAISAAPSMAYKVNYDF
jgi:long-chain fatty acid transport protein